MQLSIRSAYAQIYCTNLSETVKTTVVDRFKKQWRDNRGQQSIVVYGLPESKDDLNQAKTSFECSEMYE